MCSGLHLCHAAGDYLINFSGICDIGRIKTVGLTIVLVRTIFTRTNLRTSGTMARKPTPEPSKDPFMKVLRPLVETYFALMDKGAVHIRSLGLTGSQFDVVATLGDTVGM